MERWLHLVGEWCPDMLNAIERVSKMVWQNVRNHVYCYKLLCVSNIKFYNSYKFRAETLIIMAGKMHKCTSYIPYRIVYQKYYPLASTHVTAKVLDIVINNNVHITSDTLSTLYISYEPEHFAKICIRSPLLKTIYCYNHRAFRKIKGLQLCVGKITTPIKLYSDINNIELCECKLCKQKESTVTIVCHNQIRTPVPIDIMD